MARFFLFEKEGRPYLDRDVKKKEVRELMRKVRYAHEAQNRLRREWLAWDVKKQYWKEVLAQEEVEYVGDRKR